jgi:hypothetical protein
MRVNRDGTGGKEEKKVLGGPVVHFVVHVVCLVVMLRSGGMVLLRE